MRHILQFVLVSAALAGGPLLAHAQGIVVNPTGGNTPRQLNDKLGEQLSILDFGAVCNGTSDDSSAVLSAVASGRTIAVPDGITCNAQSVSRAQLTATFRGGGKIKTSDGVLQGPRFTSVSAAPNAATWDQASSTFAGLGGCITETTCFGNLDWSHTPDASGYVINGTQTAGHPAHNYQVMPGLNLHAEYFANNSGWNQAPDANDGRTLTSLYEVHADQNGAGDMMIFHVGLNCMGLTGPGAGGAYTNWNAVPGCAFAAGDIGAGPPSLDPEVNPQYLQVDEWHVNDNGHDVSVVGRDLGISRTFAGTPKLDNRVVGHLDSCNVNMTSGPVCDADYVIHGRYRIGLDFLEVNTAIEAPIAMSGGQKITLNGNYGPGQVNPATANLGLDWLVYDAASQSVQIADQGLPVLQASNPPGAANHWSLSGSVQGGGVVLVPVGTDTSVPAILGDKGGAGVVLESNGSVIFKGSAPSGGAAAYLELNTYSQPGYPIYLHPTSSGATPLWLGGANGAPVVSQSPFDLSGQSLKVPAHVVDVGSVPTVSSCGTGATLDPGATDHAGIVNIGSGSPTKCDVNFAVAYVNNARCTFTPGGSSLVPQLLTSLKSTTGFEVIQPNASPLPSSNPGWITYRCD